MLNVGVKLHDKFVFFFNIIINCVDIYVPQFGLYDKLGKY